MGDVGGASPLWEGPVHCGRCYPWAGHPGQYKQAMGRQLVSRVSPGFSLDFLSNRLQPFVPQVAFCHGVLSHQQELWLRHLPKRNGNLVFQKQQHTHVPQPFDTLSPETTLNLQHSQSAKHTLVYAHSKILLSNEKGQRIDSCNKGRISRLLAVYKKLYSITYMLSCLCNVAYNTTWLR